MNKAGLRPEVITFAYAMERRLRKNDLLKGAGGWKGEAPCALMQRLWEEVQKLQVALVVYPRDTPNYLASIGNEAADVANMAMMVSDVSGVLDLDVDEDPRSIDADLAFASDLARFHQAVWDAAEGGDVAIDEAGDTEVRVLIAKYRGLQALLRDQVDQLREALRLAESAAELYTRSDDCVEIDATVTFLRGAIEASGVAVAPTAVEAQSKADWPAKAGPVLSPDIVNAACISDMDAPVEVIRKLRQALAEA